MRFTVTTEQPGPLGIAELMQKHANQLWVPTHLNEDQARGFLLDHFQRAIAVELAMVDVRVATQGRQPSEQGE